jgi:hypothetical protein
MRHSREGLERLKADMLEDVRETPNAFSGCDQSRVAQELSPEPKAVPGSQIGTAAYAQGRLFA